MNLGSKRVVYFVFEPQEGVESVEVKNYSREKHAQWIPDGVPVFQGVLQLSFLNSSHKLIVRRQGIKKKEDARTIRF